MTNKEMMQIGSIVKTRNSTFVGESGFDIINTNIGMSKELKEELENIIEDSKNVWEVTMRAWETGKHHHQRNR